MKRFARLFAELDQTTKTNAKVAALAEYFREAGESDKLWTIALLSHKRPRRTVTTTLLREWSAEAAGIPDWLFEESYPIVGDLAETIALILPPGEADGKPNLIGLLLRPRPTLRIATVYPGGLAVKWPSLPPCVRDCSRMAETRHGRGSGALDKPSPKADAQICSAKNPDRIRPEAHPSK